MVSFVFMPLGFTIAGPLSEAIGVDATLAAAAALSVVAVLFPVCFPSVRDLSRPQKATGHVGEADAPSVGAR
jgi:hypothetical protein